MNSLGGKMIGLPPAVAFAPGRGRGATGTKELVRRWASQGALAGGDALCYLVAFAALRGLGWLPAHEARAGPFVALVAALCIVQFAAASLYPGYGLYDHERWRRRLLITLATALGALGVAVMLEPDWPAAAQVGPVLLLALLLQPLVRGIVTRHLMRHRLWGTEVVILADAGVARRVADALRANWRFGLIPSSPVEAGACPPTTAVLAGPLPSGQDTRTLLRTYDSLLLLADMPGLKLSGLQPSALGGRIGIVLRACQPDVGGHRLRRVIDLAIAVVMVVPALPVMGVAAGAIWMADPGPVLYRQEREGLQGRTVRVIKLRTMYRDAERRLHDVLASDPARRSEWERHFKMRDDPRILPGIGGILRSTSCDELPQLFNVIAGQMSLVGPRPFPTYHLGAMDAEFRVKRRSVMPGLTGLWQVSARSEADVERQQQLDEFYIDNRTFWFDWHILLRTAHAVLGRGGAY